MSNALRELVMDIVADGEIDDSGSIRISYSNLMKLCRLAGFNDLRSVERHIDPSEPAKDDDGTKDVHNPRLSLNLRVRLRDGRVGTIADNATHRQSRLISIDGVPDLAKVKKGDIAAIKIDQFWYDCTWS